MIAALTGTSASQSTGSQAQPPVVKKLNAEQLAEVASLAVTDRKVRDHEAAHLAAAGPYATSGASYTYATGPDGTSYAVGGEVTLDASAVPNDPEATVQKARVIQAAATAPADPSAQDRAVAAQAALMEAEAQRELAASNRDTPSPYQWSAPVETGQLLSALL